MTTLGYALLSLLACETLSGYEIAHTMQERIGNFWHARHSQIYPELARLQEEGLITHQIVEQQDRPDKKVYTITQQGMEKLRQWTTEEMDTPAIRDELVLKAYALWTADKQKAITLFRTHEQRHRAQLATYQAIEKWLVAQWVADEKRIDSPWFASYATLRRGLGYEREYIEWCAWVADTLEHNHPA